MKKKTKTEEIAKVVTTIKEIKESGVSTTLCDFTTCWHFGYCLYTSTGWEHPATTSPGLNEETKKPSCFLAKDWYKPKNKKGPSTLEELEEAKKEAKRKKKEKEKETDD